MSSVTPATPTVNTPKSWYRHEIELMVYKPREEWDKSTQSPIKWSDEEGNLHPVRTSSTNPRGERIRLPLWKLEEILQQYHCRDPKPLRKMLPNGDGTYRPATDREGNFYVEDKSKQSVPYITPGLFPPDNRQKKNWEGAWFIAIDIDSGESIEAVLAALRTMGFLAFLHTTRSHGAPPKEGKPEADRFRVIIPTAKMMNAQQFVRGAEYFAALFGGDRCVTNLTQGLYLPTFQTAYKDRVRTETVEGAILTLEEIDAFPAPVTPEITVSTRKLGPMVRATPGVTPEIHEGITLIPANTPVRLRDGECVTIGSLIVSTPDGVRVDVFCPFPDHSDPNTPTGCIHGGSNGFKCWGRHKDHFFKVDSVTSTWSRPKSVQVSQVVSNTKSVHTNPTIKKNPEDLDILSVLSGWDEPSEDSLNLDDLDILETPGVTHTVINPDTLVSGRFLPPVKLSHRVTVMSEPMGVGKTQALLASPDLRGTRITMVQPVRSLVGEAVKRAATLGLEITDYRDVKGTIPPDVDISICVDSLPRLALREDGTLVFDEIGPILAAIAAGRMRAFSAQMVLSHLVRLMRAAKHIVFADAYAPLDMIALLCSFADIPDTDVEIRTLTIPSRRSYAITTDRDQLDAMFFQDIASGYHVSAGMESTTHQNAIAKVIRTKFPDLHVGVVNSETTLLDLTTGEKVDIANLPSIAHTFDVLLYSPVLVTGASIDIPDHFTRHYTYGVSNVGTAPMTLQLAGRVRNPIDPCVRMYLPPGSVTPVTPAGVLKRDKDRVHATGYTASLLGVEHYDHRGQIMHHEFAQLWAHVQTALCLGGHRKGRFEAVLELLTMTDVPYVLIPPEITPEGTLKHEIADAHAENKQARICAIASAPDRVIPPGEEPASRQDVYTHLKASTREFYHDGVLPSEGGTPVTPELVALDNGGNYRPKVQAAARTRLLTEGKGSTLTYAEMSRTRKLGTAPLTQAFIVHRLLKRLGIDAKELLSGVAPAGAMDTTTWPATAQWALKNQKQLALVGLNVPKDICDRPAWLAHRCLAILGLTLHKETKRVFINPPPEPEGKKTRRKKGEPVPTPEEKKAAKAAYDEANPRERVSTYTLDAVEVATLHTLMASEYNRMVARADQFLALKTPPNTVDISAMLDELLAD